MTTVYQGAFVRFPDATPTRPDAQLVPVVSGAPNQGLSLWGTAPSDLWLAGVRLSHATGSGAATTVTLQSQFYNDSTNSNTIGGIWGLNNSDLWMVAVNGGTRSSRVHHISNPSSIDSSVYVSLGNYQLNTLSGLSASYIWFVGNGGLRIHHDGKSYQVIRDL